MKRNLFLKICCCLLAMFLLAGCKGEDTEPSKLNYWELTDYIRVGFSVHHNGFVNDDGEVLYYRQTGNYLGDWDISHLEGSMECYQWSPDLEEAYVPYSRYLEVATRCPMPDRTAGFSAAFVKDGVEEKYISVIGKYEGHVKLSADGTAVLYGHNTDDITVIYYMPQETEDEGRVYYELHGDAEEYAEFFMGETERVILTKGMAGNYTVTTYQDGVTEGEFSFTQKRKPLCIREYDKDGNLLSTTEE